MTQDSASQAFFLGPHAENEQWVRAAFLRTLEDWFGERRAAFPDDPPLALIDNQPRPRFAAARDQLTASLETLVSQLRGELRTYTPRYLGHMSSETALPGLLGHFAALLHNPNNTSPEASRVGTVIETEAIRQLAAMIGFDAVQARGHFTSGGTLANLEAVWRARFRLDSRLALGVLLAEQKGMEFDAFSAAHRPQAECERLIAQGGFDEAVLRSASGVCGNALEIAERIGRAGHRPYRGPVILVPGHRHYSWAKAANLFGLGAEAIWSVPLDRDGRLCPAALASRIQEAGDKARPILMVVSVAGTTERGLIDPVDEVAETLRRLRADPGTDIWHHVDAAYGGFFCALDPAEPQVGPAQRRALRAIRLAETVTIDPHKLGYAPYACGALLVREPACDAVSAFTAPYLARPDLEAAPWARTIEGSRPATGAAATWLTGMTLGFAPEGLGAVLRGTLQSCGALRTTLVNSIPEVRPLDPVDTNILCFSIASAGEPLSSANARTAAVHDRMTASPAFSMSRTVIGADSHTDLIAAHVGSYGGRMDADHLVLLRCVVMNPAWSDPQVRQSLLPELVAELRGMIAATARVEEATHVAA